LISALAEPNDFATGSKETSLRTQAWLKAEFTLHKKTRKVLLVTIYRVLKHHVVLLLWWKVRWGFE
jgi:hypothetical protein